KNPQASCERLLGLYRIDQRLRVVFLLGSILLHGPNVRPVNGEQDVAVNLQMMRSCIFWRCDKRNGLRLGWVAHVDDRITVAEHVTDKRVSLLQDDLHAVGPATLLTARQKADIPGCRCTAHLKTG